METFLTFIHVVVALFMVLVVLVQGGNSGGMGAAFGGGGGAGSLMGATGGQSFLGKLTYGAAAVFMVTSITLTKMQSDSSEGLKGRLEQRINENAGAAVGDPAVSEKTEDSSAAPEGNAEGTKP